MKREPTMLVDSGSPRIGDRTGRVTSPAPFPDAATGRVLDTARARPRAVAAPSALAQAVGVRVLRVALAVLSLLLALAAVAVTAGLLVFQAGVGVAVLLEPLEVAPALLRPSWVMWTAAAGIVSAVDAAAFVLVGAGRAAAEAVSAIGAAGLGAAALVSGAALSGPWTPVLFGCAVAQLLLAVALDVARTAATRHQGS